MYLLGLFCPVTLSHVCPCLNRGVIIERLRCNSLKGDYTEQAIRERIEGVRVVAQRKKSKRPTVPKVGLLINIDAAIRAGKGPGYERWAKVFNLKQLSQAVLYLKEHGDMSYDELKERTSASVMRFNELSAEIIVNRRKQQYNL